MTGIDVARRLIALLRIVERTSADTADVPSDDALLDAWFGIRSPSRRLDLRLDPG